jgi:hypothetical protein
VLHEKFARKIDESESFSSSDDCDRELHDVAALIGFMQCQDLMNKVTKFDENQKIGDTELCFWVWRGVEGCVCGWSNSLRLCGGFGK